VSYVSAQAACEVALGEGWKVRPEPQLIAELGNWLTPENIQLIYAAA
jgi:hypothetical protein